MLQLFKKALHDNNQEVLQEFSKIIAMVVRNEMEDFHVAYLTDKQMAELNPLIRKGIYNALFAIAISDTDTIAQKFLTRQLSLMPDYWEDSELLSQFKAIVEKTSHGVPVTFQSKFLAEQYAIGNIYVNLFTRCIEIKASFDFIDVPGDKHSHRSKISAQLRKEGYVFMPALQGYAKTF